jgi:glycosyltransferase involved in cell wall biosynthesis
MTAAPRILFLVHGHPRLHAGGTEILAHDLFQAVKAEGAEAMFVAAVNAGERERKNGTEFQTVDGAADEVLLWSEGFDAFNLMRRDGLGIGPDLRELLSAFKPDVVHLHHLLGIGVETLFMLRRELPQAKLVMTLHDYVPICANDGLMVKRGTEELCTRASADTCHGCFPEIHQSRFVLRQRHLLRHLGLIDGFITPSRFARDRFMAFGLPPARIEHIPNARPAVQSAAAAPREGARNRFGLFGNLAPHKGVRVAIQAAKHLIEQGDVDFELQLHGSLRHQTADFRDEVMKAVAESGGRITWAGGYEETEVATRMAGVDWVLAPSTWWENAPLVVLEAFGVGRPPIVSGIGGLAEQVRDGVDGLHVAPKDPIALARAMREAATNPALWGRLVANRPTLPSMREIAERHLAFYAALEAPARAAA